MQWSYDVFFSQGTSPSQLRGMFMQLQLYVKMSVSNVSTRSKTGGRAWNISLINISSHFSKTIEHLQYI